MPFERDRRRSRPRARTLNALQVSFGSSLIAAIVNVVFGVIVAWVLVRYKFPGKRILDAIVDLPFALPTAVAGIALSTLYAPKGWIGWLFDDAGPLNGALQWMLGALANLKPLIDTPWDLNWLWAMQINWKIAYTPTGIVIALIFIGLPFVVRTVQPVLEEFEQELEEAAATLGANRWQTITRVILPRLTPGDPHRLRARLRARRRRVRLGHLHRRQPAQHLRDRAAPDRHQARGVRSGRAPR